MAGAGGKPARKTSRPVPRKRGAGKGPADERSGPTTPASSTSGKASTSSSKKVPSTTSRLSTVPGGPRALTDDEQRVLLNLANHVPNLAELLKKSKVQNATEKVDDIRKRSSEILAKVEARRRGQHSERAQTNKTSCWIARHERAGRKEYRTKPETRRELATGEATVKSKQDYTLPPSKEKGRGRWTGLGLGTRIFPVVEGLTIFEFSAWDPSVVGFVVAGPAYEILVAAAASTLVDDAFNGPLLFAVWGNDGAGAWKLAIREELWVVWLVRR
ncbi:hypothetical protein OE88DRAFT_1649145 [Heliocybe sulcata]|uniref:Uncharacterized protein n=1 Tax=Heliocybe sulcata TaxID=5364 RepID=A0A5C3MK36_9AGAM|nr:hypothetical protein OE88DRAFT_1649145 [Heliocybe sulcata]